MRRLADGVILKVCAPALSDTGLAGTNPTRVPVTATTVVA
jgi:hypothetical protein